MAQSPVERGKIQRSALTDSGKLFFRSYEDIRPHDGMIEPPNHLPSLPPISTSLPPVECDRSRGLRQSTEPHHGSLCCASAGPKVVAFASIFGTGTPRASGLPL